MLDPVKLVAYVLLQARPLAITLNVVQVAVAPTHTVLDPVGNAAVGVITHLPSTVTVLVPTTVPVGCNVRLTVAPAEVPVPVNVGIVELLDPVDGDVIVIVPALGVTENVEAPQV
jgi:hypothetical protein